MLFNSYEFIFLFLPISFFIYFYLNHKRLVIASKTWLVFSSLFFYSWWNITYLPLLLVSIVVNYTIAGMMLEYDKKKYFSRKSLLQIGLVFNIGLLGYFKYMDFFISNTNAMLKLDIELLHVALPLAISFFTLQQIAFIVDSYEGLVKEKNFLDYTIFVTFFPQLIAGPIVHHKEMMPQFANIRNKVKNYKNIALGLFIFSIGLFKKVVIADTFAVWATLGFDTATTLNLFEAWATSLSYTFQMYFDFSGYMDMAIGAALLFNIKLPINFNSPYKATGMIDYWKRWHITLTEFITTYIYTPIIKLFSPITFDKAMFVTIIVFLISGLWHGASWMFVFWGLFHGFGVIINHYWQKKVKIRLNRFLAWLITFNFVNITFVFFRAQEWNDAVKVLKGMVDFSSLNKIDIFSNWVLKGFPHSSFTIDVLIYLLFFGFIVFFMPNSMEISKNRFKLNYKYAIIFAFLFFTSILVAFFGNTVPGIFLYFNF